MEGSVTNLTQLHSSNVHQQSLDIDMTNPSTGTMGSQETDKEMSTSPCRENIRICLVGTVANDESILQIAQKFQVPIITSEDGIEYASDESWLTYFILNDFEGPAYQGIYKTKHKILGPPVLKYAADSGEGLPKNNRPIYNYAMRGVTTCFTGIRTKDTLIRLVQLIHFMGGSIRKDMNTRITHLICNASIGEKYQYAMTFRLPAIRPAWVIDAWESRDSDNFSAKDEQFIKQHKLKVFEGQKVCFFGFPADEHHHMVDVLKLNGGIPTDIEDPECSHVIISNTGSNFPELLPHNPESPSATPLCETTHTKNIVMNDEKPIETCVNNENAVPSSFMSRLEQLEEEERNEIEEGCTIPAGAMDGIILIAKKEDTKFLNPNDISPILRNKYQDESLHRINEEDEEEDDDFANASFKRKRVEDSFDNASLLSTDSIACPSVKKPKLIRTGSIKKNLRRSMSFAAMKTPFASMLRSRRNSVDPNASISSISSITSINSTFNESIKKPIKEKLRSIKDKITKSTKKDLTTPKSKSKNILTSANLDSLKKVCTFNSSRTDTADVLPDLISDCDGFKTPLAPPRTPMSHSIRSSSSHTFNRSMITASEFISNNKTPTGSGITNATLVTGSTDSDKAQPEIDKTSKEEIGKSDEVDQAASTATAERQPVVDEHVTTSKPEPRNNRTHIVKSEWFWYTIQNGYADETDYLFGDYLDSIANTPGSERRDSYPISFNKRKRKRLSRHGTDGTPVGTSSGKRRSSVSDAGLLSVSGSFLECTASPDKNENSKSVADKSIAHEKSAKAYSMRRNHFMDFFHTESNYVGILETIVKVFKEPLEKMLEDNPEDSLLNQTELKGIFSNFLPIYEVHTHMLNRLKEIQQNWFEDCLIGQIIIENRDELIKAYPPYVNFFEQMKETLLQCDTQKPRFHAFLKICQAKPECGRQSLQDLMIRPVQRLPSISLLLNDILKHTAKTNPDNKCLNDALKAIKEVMTYINEDKRKTEGQLAMFDIFNDIDNCPPHLVSSHRSFVSRCEVTELTNTLSGRGDSLVLFLFSDALEVCKKRSRGFGTVKSPGTNGLNTVKVQANKPYKHLKLIPLSSIKYIIDLNDSNRAFAIECKLCGDTKEKLYSFSICDEELDKILYLRILSKQMAENACRTDNDKHLLTQNSEELKIDINDVNIGTLSKAFKFAARTRLKVGRAFSFNKTPLKSKNGSSRTTAQTFGSTNSLTPSTQLENLKLASCMNLNEHHEDTVSMVSGISPTGSEILVAPKTVEPTRRHPQNKNLISIAALRRIKEY